jgi:predicted negative regulator of RcsB-dependent stress response
VDLLSEDEQWDALKRWIRVNGPSILGMVVVALAAWYGWRWWKGHEDQQALAASAMYDKVLATFDADKLDEGAAQVEALRTAYPKSVYVSAADLAAARVYVALNELDKAAAYLERVANTSLDQQLRPVARLRLARVQSAQGQYDKALATLGTANMGVHQSAYLEARGDVLFAKGDRAGALKAYEESRALLTPEAAGPEGVGQVLDLKISDLKAAT